METKKSEKGSFRNGVKSKVLVPAGLLMLAIIVVLSMISIISLNRSYDDDINSAKNSYDQNIKTAVQTVISALTANYARVADGSISEDDALEAAKVIVRDSRYSSGPGKTGDGYFWADKADGECVVHYNAANVGLMRLDFQDQNGEYYIRDFIAEGDKGGGFTDFYFGKPGDENGSYKKRAYTQIFEPYGWYISTGNYYDDIDVTINNINNQRYWSDAILLIASVLTAALGLILLSISLNRIVKPIRSIAKDAAEIANGNLNINGSYGSNDEIGRLNGAFGKIVSTLKELISDMTNMADKQDKGDIDVRIDSEKFNGAYREVAAGVNGMVDSDAGIILDIINVLNSISNGDFEISVKQFPGKKAVINETMDRIRASLNGISAEIRTMAAAASEGALSKRADAGMYEGDWAKILTELNALLENISAPIREASAVLLKISNGELEERINGDYKGDFALIKTSMNAMSESVSSYIKEISEILTGISSNDLNQEITRDYVGQFGVIKTSINMIIDKLNSVMGDMNIASQQVSAGSSQISDSSMTLAEGASKQAASVEELTAAIENINEKSNVSVNNASQARKLSDKSRESAAAGNEKMQLMLEAMDSIKKSSQSISRIIKTIEDIAFQTNLLALNAAVEAARAGAHGAGFTVVAGEVRSLASMSQQSAKDSAGLIESSIRQVEEGSKIAGLTAQFLSAIVGNVSEVSDIIENIANDSAEQSDALKNVSEGLQEINQVVQTNSSTSEETAAAAVELSGQSETLKNMVSAFSLKRKK